MWASNDVGNLWRESAFFWVLPVTVFAFAWEDGMGEVLSGGRDHLAPGPGRDGEDTTGWNRTRHEGKGQKRKVGTK